MGDIINIIEPLFERAEEYGKTSINLYKLKALEQTAGVLSTFVSRGIAVLVFLIFLIMLNIALALWLGDVLGKLYYGFFCVAGLYAVIGVNIYFFMHQHIKKSISNSFISHILN